MRRDADWGNAPAPTPVRDAERLMQVQVANVRTKVSGSAKSDLSVHVRPVHVDLAPIAVDNVANLPDRFLENSVGGRIRDHQRGQLVRMLFRPCCEISNIDVAG